MLKCMSITGLVRLQQIWIYFFVFEIYDNKELEFLNLSFENYWLPTIVDITYVEKIKNVINFIKKY